MSHSSGRNVLLIGVSREEAQQVAPFLDRSGFGVDRFPSAEGALELLGQVPFDLLVVRFPLPDINVLEVLQTVRREDSACLHSPLILLAVDVEHESEAGFYVGFGANRVLGINDPPDKVHGVISDLLDIAPRVDLRVPVHLEVKVGDQVDTLSALTSNISRSGMLLAGKLPVSKGDRATFELELPGGELPIRGAFEIVRESIPDKGDEGTGVRFDSFSGDGRERLLMYLSRLG